jgi:hypothetical protein
MRCIREYIIHTIGATGKSCMEKNHQDLEGSGDDSETQKGRTRRNIKLEANLRHELYLSDLDLPPRMSN